MLRLTLALICSAGAVWAVPAATPVPVLGVAWYPEQWPESNWERDLSLMEAAGIRMVRVGEFAWSSLEPAEGRFQLEWLERAIDKAGAHHIQTVIGTPTDAPPAWLTQKYPETLRVDSNGRRAEHGGRRQFSYSSPKYRELCRIIVDRLAARFAANPNVIGWQIGNEYTDESFDDFSQRQFQKWLQAKYKTLDALNSHWATAYWSETYTSWDQIPMDTGRPNPGLMLEYRRFVSETWRDFQRNQLDAIRAHTKTQFTTTNFGGLGWTDKFDHYLVASDLDFISWDDYVGMGHLDVARNAAVSDFVRGWMRRNFWVMEAQPGFVDWAQVSNALYKGETRAMAWQSVGHGADCVAFWQWRSALNGQEQYHGSLVGPDGEPVPLYEEIRGLGAEFLAAGKALAGTEPQSDVAIVQDYDSRWAIDGHPQSQRYDQLKVLLDYYRPLERLTQSVDIVNPNGRLDGYKVVVAPSLNVISAALAAHLLEYVRQGGHLVLGPRSGMKDEYNSLHTQRQPGPLRDALGGRVEQFYALLNDVPVGGAWGQGTASIWAEALSATNPNTETLMRYGTGDGWLEGQAAVLTRPVDKGRITYVGALLDDATMQRLASWMIEGRSVSPAFGTVPADVEVCRRVGQDHVVFILINHGQKPRTVTLPGPMRDVLAHDTERTSIELTPQGVAVLQLPRMVR